MTIASHIAPTLAARAAKAASRDAERQARDAFIVAQFAALGASFDALLRAALGVDARLQVTVAPLTYAVQGRSFATLTVDTWIVRASFNAVAQTVVFTPRLDFRQPDQFGLVECALDFDYRPARNRGDLVAQALLDPGVLMSGKTVGALRLPLAKGTAPLGADALEAAFAAWWLR